MFRGTSRRLDLLHRFKTLAGVFALAKAVMKVIVGVPFASFQGTVHYFCTWWAKVCWSGLSGDDKLLGEMDTHLATMALLGKYEIQYSGRTEEKKPLGFPQTRFPTFCFVERQ